MVGWLLVLCCMLERRAVGRSSGMISLLEEVQRLKGEGAEIVPLIYWVLCLSNYQNYCKTDDKCSHVDVICMCLLMY